MSTTCTVGGPNVRLAARIVDDRLMRCATMSSCRQAVISRECKATLISSRVRSKCPERERERERGVLVVAAEILLNSLPSVWCALYAPPLTLHAVATTRCA